MELRNDVLWFAEQMELKLRGNDHKGGWDLCEPQWLLKRLKEEVKELSETLSWRDADLGRSASEGVLFRDVSNEEIIKECADIANFALMIADLHKH